ncbi:unnamed protein product [Paramecium primaurelia]|uniref:Uncharacterized protein n=1 Tax=Paramecium primaurelia TaxID=5886 RepID=A0A8S1KAV8_PARPR|nr:unnamed protein product [Paramecium primaurelia]
MGCHIQKHQYTKNDIIISSPNPTVPSSHEIILMPYALDQQHPASRIPIQILWNIEVQRTKEQSSEITNSISPNIIFKQTQK